VVAAIRAGAIGYVLKDTRGEELKAAIRASRTQAALHAVRMGIVSAGELPAR